MGGRFLFGECFVAELIDPLAADPATPDLLLTAIERSCRLTPRTVLGMLWVQTHFETSTWDLVCSGNVRLSRHSSEALCRDAIAAGLQVDWSTGSDPSQTSASGDTHRLAS